MEKKYIQFVLDPEIYKKAKIRLLEQDQTIQEYFEGVTKRLVSEGTDSFGVPEEIVEMANLGPRLTGGLPKVIHIWHQGEDKRGPHAPRIKASFYSNRFDPKENVSITISDDPQIVAPDNFKFSAKFTKKEFEQIKDWIKKRKEKLLKYWNDSSVTVDEILSESVDGFGLPGLLMEMANAIQKYTGLPGVVYFCTKDELSNKQAHALGRVKWIHAGKEVFLTIKKNSDGKRIASGDSRMISKLEKFVSKNEEVLWEYWNTPKEDADSAEVMKKFNKV